MIEVYYSEYNYVSNIFWGYKETKYIQHKDWDFTGRIKYWTHIGSSGEKTITVDFEVEDVKETLLPNPSYCKYFGDQRKTIPGKLTYWIVEDKFTIREYTKPSLTETIYTC